MEDALSCGQRMPFFAPLRLNINFGVAAFDLYWLHMVLRLSLFIIVVVVRWGEYILFCKYKKVFYNVLVNFF